MSVRASVHVVGRSLLVEQSTVLAAAYMADIEDASDDDGDDVGSTSSSTRLSVPRIRRIKKLSSVRKAKSSSSDNDNNLAEDSAKRRKHKIKDVFHDSFGRRRNTTETIQRAQRLSKNQATSDWSDSPFLTDKREAGHSTSTISSRDSPARCSLPQLLIQPTQLQPTTRKQKQGCSKQMKCKKKSVNAEVNIEDLTTTNQSGCQEIVRRVSQVRVTTFVEETQDAVAAAVITGPRNLSGGKEKRDRSRTSRKASTPVKAGPVLLPKLPPIVGPVTCRTPLPAVCLDEDRRQPRQVSPGPAVRTYLRLSNAANPRLPVDTTQTTPTRLVTQRRRINSQPSVKSSAKLESSLSKYHERSRPMSLGLASSVSTVPNMFPALVGMGKKKQSKREPSSKMGLESVVVNECFKVNKRCSKDGVVVAERHRESSRNNNSNSKGFTNGKKKLATNSTMY